MPGKKVQKKSKEQVVETLGKRVTRLKARLAKTEDVLKARSVRKKVKRAQRRRRGLKAPAAPAAT